MKNITITDLENLETDIPLILDFYADWCVPCKSLKPVLESLEKEYPNINFFKVNTEVEIELASNFNIRSIPTLLFIKNDEIIDYQIGTTNKINIIQKIEKLL